MALFSSLLQTKMLNERPDVRLTIKDFDCLNTKLRRFYLILSYVLRTSAHYQTKHLNLVDLSVFYFRKRIYICLHVRVNDIMVRFSTFKRKLLSLPQSSTLLIVFCGNSSGPMSRYLRT